MCPSLYISKVYKEQKKKKTKPHISTSITLLGSPPGFGDTVS